MPRRRHAHLRRAALLARGHHPPRQVVQQPVQGVRAALPWIDTHASALEAHAARVGAGTDLFHEREHGSGALRTARMRDDLVVRASARTLARRTLSRSSFSAWKRGISAAGLVAMRRRDSLSIRAPLHG